MIKNFGELIDRLNAINMNFSPYGYGPLSYISRGNPYSMYDNPYEDDEFEPNYTLMKDFIKKHKKIAKSSDIKKNTYIKGNTIFGGDVAHLLEQFDDVVWNMFHWRSGDDVDFWEFKQVVREYLPKVLNTKLITHMDCRYLEAGNEHSFLEVLEDLGIARL